MINKKSLSKEPALNRSLLIANLSILWILVFLFAYVWGGYIDKIEHNVILKVPGDYISFWLQNYLPFIIGAFGISYAVFCNWFSDTKTIQNIACLTGILILGSFLSVAFIVSVQVVAIMVLGAPWTM